MRKITLCVAAGLLAATVAACGGAPKNTGGAAPVEVHAAIVTADGSVKETVLIADPQGAVDAVYQSLDGGHSIDEITEDRLDEVFGIPSYMVLDVVAYVSDVKGGLCDVAVIEPAPGMTDDVREALNEYKTLRAESFKNYDILNAYAIASNAVVFNQGDYVVLLMLPDNEAAREILDQYMPQ